MIFFRKLIATKVQGIIVRKDICMFMISMLIVVVNCFSIIQTLIVNNLKLEADTKLHK